CDVCHRFLLSLDDPWETAACALRLSPAGRSVRSQPAPPCNTGQAPEAPAHRANPSAARAGGGWKPRHNRSALGSSLPPIGTGLFVERRVELRPVARHQPERHAADKAAAEAGEHQEQQKTSVTHGYPLMAKFRAYRSMQRRLNAQ